MVAEADGDIVEVSQFIQQTAAGKVRRITRLKKHCEDFVLATLNQDPPEYRGVGPVKVETPMGPQETMVEFRLNAKTVTEAFSLYDAALVAMQPEIQEQVNQQVAAQRLRGGPGGPPGGILRG